MILYTYTAYVCKAVFAFHDYVAIDALQAAADRGLRAPEDIAIAGFDGMSSTLATSPKLTTVEQPIQEIGKRAAEMLISHTPTQIILPTQLLIRESTVG
ncbi:substrate-binding domain-containing protein [Chloroflexota bacterium]